MNIISGLSALSSLSSLLPASTQRVAGDSDSDSAKSSGGIGKSNFMSAISQALDQSLSGSSGATSTSHKTSTTAQDPQAALQGFLQNLFASLGQVNVAGKAGDSDGSQPLSGAGSRHGGHGSHDSNIAASLQGLLQQLSANGTTNSSSNDGSSSGTSNSLSNLNSSFQNLITSINSAQGQTAPTPTLQSFLQNLMQDIGKGQNISGTLVSTQA